MKTREQKQEELAKKRAGEVKKTTSIRLSSNERSIVEKKAMEKGMNPSTYISYTAVYGCEEIAPEVKIRAQNAINHAADALEQFAPAEAKKIRTKRNAIWDL